MQRFMESKQQKSDLLNNWYCGIRVTPTIGFYLFHLEFFAIFCFFFIGNFYCSE